MAVVFKFNVIRKTIILKYNLSTLKMGISRDAQLVLFIYRSFVTVTVWLQICIIWVKVMFTQSSYVNNIT
jgi:hypothetical protein